MSDRSQIIEWIRGEMVGPARPLREPTLIAFAGTVFNDSEPQRRGQIVWRPRESGDPEEVLYFQRESPHRKYGMGMLHPVAANPITPEEVTDTIGVDNLETEGDGVSTADDDDNGDDSSDTDDFEVTGPDIRRPSTMGISFCVRLDERGQIIVRLPLSKTFAWQGHDGWPFGLNGRYEPCKRQWNNGDHGPQNDPMWRRHPALPPDTQVVIEKSELIHGRTVRKELPMSEGSPLKLCVDLFPRMVGKEADNVWLITVVLRNITVLSDRIDPKEATLYQAYFEVVMESGSIESYPESQRPFDELDEDEKSLALLYRESATWGIGHGCAAGWDAEPGEAPRVVYADVMPAVELPSMTPDIKDEQGDPIKLSMRALAALPENGEGEDWNSLMLLAGEYKAWIERSRCQIQDLEEKLRPVARKHLDTCEFCLGRIEAGITLLRSDQRVRRAFRLANLAMLLQQIASKKLKPRPLLWDAGSRLVIPQGTHDSPWKIYSDGRESDRVGSWRAFQIAFLLMSLDGVKDGDSPDREIVDLIWFPTGGGKTEAYLAVMAFYMFHERLLMSADQGGPVRDGVNVLMRYTLRMLTTQQFQRAASLICGMEFLRRNPESHGMGEIPGRRFSLGLWIGGDGSPNRISKARTELNDFKSGKIKGNPLVLTECPWCRAGIGRYDGDRPKDIKERDWNSRRVIGIRDMHEDGPLLHCTDPACCFGCSPEHSTWLPVEVIDERIYKYPPSLVIATADKLAMVAYRPQAGALFGCSIHNNEPRRVSLPPGLIIQDELHLISGPLGTMYALYEGIFERLCSFEHEGRWIKPKLVASTATIRGASEQVMSLYARKKTCLFPSPGLVMGDSFFGKYARNENGALLPGRLYLGIHATDYGSVLTAQVRAFSSALFRPYSFSEDRRDAWWTVLAFYNSLRELGGAKTLFDSDIRSRLKFMFNRENFAPAARRHLPIIEELTSRLSQSEIVKIMDRLSAPYAADSPTVDACLASNIIEVGVDIDRLSLMGVVGQPKTTAQYIQVTGRVGRRWEERAGLILMIYNPSKSRDRSHFEQFQSYHRRLYERVEPTSATPFALSALRRALPGALLVWARLQSDAPVSDLTSYQDPIDDAFALLKDRCKIVQLSGDQQRSLEEMDRVLDELMRKWALNPQLWEKFPPDVSGEYLMHWPGQFYTRRQKSRGMEIPSNMRQVDGSAELTIDQAYGAKPAAY
jgi:hypothetical protein